MNRRTVLIASAATIAVTAVSLGAAAAAQSASGHPSSNNGGAGMAWAARCPTPSLAGSEVGVVAADMTKSGVMGGIGMMVGRMMLRVYPQTVPAGTVSLRVVNHGTRAHELVVLPLSVGQAVGTRAVGSNRTVDETGSLGEASADCATGVGQGVRPGGASWLTLTLTPGRYELICNLPGHYAAGMFAELEAI